MHINRQMTGKYCLTDRFQFHVMIGGTHEADIAGFDNDPEKIGIHMLEMLAKFRNEGVVD